MSYIAAAFFILAEPKKWGEGKGTPDNDDSDDDHSHDQGDQQSTSNAGSNWMEKGDYSCQSTLRKEKHKQRASIRTHTSCICKLHQFGVQVSVYNRNVVPIKVCTFNRLRYLHPHPS